MDVLSTGLFIEPPFDKTNKMVVRPAKTLISPGGSVSPGHTDHFVGFVMRQLKFVLTLVW